MIVLKITAISLVIIWTISLLIFVAYEWYYNYTEARKSKGERNE